MNNYDVFYTSSISLSSKTGSVFSSVTPYTFPTSTNVQVASATSAAFMKTTKDKFVHVEYKCNAAADEYFTNIGTLFTFAKDAATDVTYTVQRQNNCLSTDLVPDDGDIVSVTGDATFMSATSTAISFDETDDTFRTG